MVYDFASDTFGCPACEERFTCDDGSEWEDYAGHLRAHLWELMDDE